MACDGFEAEGWNCEEGEEVFGSRSGKRGERSCRSVFCREACVDTAPSDCRRAARPGSAPVGSGLAFGWESSRVWMYI